MFDARLFLLIITFTLFCHLGECSDVQLNVLADQNQAKLPVALLRHISIDKLKNALKTNFDIELDLMLEKGAFACVYNGTNNEGNERAFKIYSLDNVWCNGRPQFLKPDFSSEQFENELIAMEKLGTSRQVVRQFSHLKFSILNDKASEIVWNSIRCKREPQGVGILELELFNGGTMKKMLETLHQQRKLTKKVVLWLLYQNALVANQLHQHNVYHHDLHLNNLLLNGEMDDQGRPLSIVRVAAVDFGLSNSQMHYAIPKRGPSSPHDLQQFCRNLFAFREYWSEIMYGIFRYEEYCLPLATAERTSSIPDDLSYIQQQLREHAGYFDMIVDEPLSLIDPSIVASSHFEQHMGPPHVSTPIRAQSDPIGCQSVLYVVDQFLQVFLHFFL